MPDLSAKSIKVGSSIEPKKSDTGTMISAPLKKRSSKISESQDQSSQISSSVPIISVSKSIDTIGGSSKISSVVSSSKEIKVESKSSMTKVFSSKVQNNAEKIDQQISNFTENMKDESLVSEIGILVDNDQVYTKETLASELKNLNGLSSSSSIIQRFKEAIDKSDNKDNLVDYVLNTDVKELSKDLFMMFFNLDQKFAAEIGKDSLVDDQKTIEKYAEDFSKNLKDSYQKT